MKYLLTVALILLATLAGASTIQVKTGTDATLPASFKMGEPAFTSDTHRVFVGYSSGKVELQKVGSTPTPHASTHKAGGADALTAADVGALPSASAKICVNVSGTRIRTAWKYTDISDMWLDFDSATVGGYNPNGLTMFSKWWTKPNAGPISADDLATGSTLLDTSVTDWNNGPYIFQASGRTAAGSYMGDFTGGNHAHNSTPTARQVSATVTVDGATVANGTTVCGSRADITVVNNVQADNTIVRGTTPGQGAGTDYSDDTGAEVLQETVHYALTGDGNVATDTTIKALEGLYLRTAYALMGSRRAGIWDGTLYWNNASALTPYNYTLGLVADSGAKSSYPNVWQYSIRGAAHDQIGWIDLTYGLGAGTSIATTSPRSFSTSANKVYFYAVSGASNTLTLAANATASWRGGYKFVPHTQMGNTADTLPASAASGFIPVGGNAATATALASTPSSCAAGYYPLGVDASGNALNCTAASSGGSGSGTVAAGTAGQYAYYTSDGTTVGGRAVVQADITGLKATDSPTFSAVTSTNDATIHGMTIGRGAGNISTNTQYGASALSVNSTGYDNTAVGFGTLTGISTNSDSTGVGYYAVHALTGAYNTGVGSYALGSTSGTGAYNSALGYQALNFATSGNQNTGVGAEALKSVTTGSYNTALGSLAAYTGLTNIAGCTFLGAAATSSTDGVSNATAIGYQANASYTNSTAVGKGATTTAANQMVFGNSSVTANVFNGTITGTQLISTVASGTAPLTVTSPTKVANLNAEQVDGADLDTDGTFAANSDTKIPSQKAVKVYADTKAALTGATFTGTVTAKSFRETPYAPTGTAITPSIANGTIQRITLTAATTITYPTLQGGDSLTLNICQGATGYAVTWSGTAPKWQAGTPYVVDTTANKCSKIVFDHDGTDAMASGSGPY